MERWEERKEERACVLIVVHRHDGVGENKAVDVKYTNIDEEKIE